MRENKIFLFLVFVGIFSFISIVVFARHLCSDPPLENFADGSKSKTFSAAGGLIEGPHFKLPTNSTICFAKLKIDFTGGTIAGIFTPYVWIPVSGANQLVQIKTSDGSIVHTFSNGNRNCGSNAFSNPSRITTIPGGDIWVANRNNGTVTRLGRISGCSGDDCYECKGTYGDVGDGPRGVTYDSQGNVWVGAYNTENICVYNSNGSLITCNNSSGCKTYGMIGDRSGNVWISDRANGQLCKCQLSGSSINCTVVDSLTTDAYGIGMDNEDHIWVVKAAGSGEFCEYDGSSLRCGMFTGAGGGWGKARGVAVDLDNNIWVAASSDNTVRKFDQGGSALCSVSLGGATGGGQGPIGIAVDGQNYVWVVFHDNPGRVYKIDSNCNIALGPIYVGSLPYNYSDMTGIRTPLTEGRIGTGGTFYNFTTKDFPIIICSASKPEVGCDPTDPHVKIDPSFASSIQNILANCNGGTQILEETWCGNPICDVPVYINSYYLSGDFTISDLRIEWQSPPSNLRGGFVPCGRICDDPDTEIFEDCPCRTCHFLVMGDRIIKFLLFRVLIPVAILLVVIGGIMFLTATGNPERVAKAKILLKNTIIGTSIVFGAWMIVNTILMFIDLAHWTGPSWTGLETAWWEIECPVPGFRCRYQGTTYSPCYKSATEYCKLPWE